MNKPFKLTLFTVLFVSLATESAEGDTPLSAVISPDDAPNNKAAVTNGDLSGSENVDMSGHVEESTYEPVSVGAQVSYPHFLLKLSWEH